LRHGRVSAAFGRQYLVELEGGESLICFPRAKRSELACGDRVALIATGSGQGVIEAPAPRSSLVMRSTGHRMKLIAANVDQVAVVVATDPSFSDEFLSRALAAAEQQQLRSLIVLNKIDLGDGAFNARERLEPFERAGYRVLPLSARQDVAPLLELLHDRTTVLVGQSGMGKSTLINALFPGTNAATRAISSFLASGRHTTTSSRLYALPGKGAVIDCPGMQEYGLAHLAYRDIERGFIEMRPYLGHCRFADCRHLSEPACAVREAVNNGTISARRLELLHRIAMAERAR
jgi:ribosome biogenesis GTPase